MVGRRPVRCAQPEQGFVVELYMYNVLHGKQPNDILVGDRVHKSVQMGNTGMSRTRPSGAVDWGAVFITQLGLV